MTAVGESAIGVLLLLVPTVLLAFLFGPGVSEWMTPSIGRVSGVALIGLGVGSWRVRSDASARTQFGWITGLLIYNVLATALLVVAGVLLKMVGPFLWPAVLYHLVLVAWGVDRVRSRLPSSIRGEPSP